MYWFASTNGTILHKLEANWLWAGKIIKKRKQNTCYHPNRKGKIQFLKL